MHSSNAPYRDLKQYMNRYEHGFLSTFQCVSTVTIEYEGHVNTQALDTFLQDLLWEKLLKNQKGETIDIYRLKV